MLVNQNKPAVYVTWAKMLFIFCNIHTHLNMLSLVVHILQGLWQTYTTQLPNLNHPN